MIALLLVASGCAGLIYEVVWFQLLQLVIGSSAVSLAVLLGTFMGGMCLGSLLLSRVISTERHPLRVYALIELAVGVFGLAVLVAMPVVGRVYSTSVGHGLPGLLLRGIVAMCCLLPPTLLMGASLPALARWVEATPRGVSWMGLLYGGNTVGAVVGCLLAGFYLLRVHDLAIATYVAAGINGVVALVSAAAAAVVGRSALAAGHGVPVVQGETPRAWAVHVVIAISGLSALGAEVVWTRLLSLLLGPTVYAFAIILACFLVGLGIGSAVGSVAVRWVAKPRVVLGVCQALLMAGTTFAAVRLASILPVEPYVPSLSTNLWVHFQPDVARCLFTVLPAACLWGASFPLALAAAARPGHDPGRLVGGIYAANTVGAIVGAVVTPLLVIPWFGTQGAQRLIIAMCGASAFLTFLPLLWSSDRQSTAGDDRPAPLLGMAGTVSLIAVVVTVPFLVASVPPVPDLVIAYGRDAFNRVTEPMRVLYRGEGMNASVAVIQLPSGIRNFHVSGKVEASSQAQDMRLQRMLGHLPALIHTKPRSVLVVGCGAGVTAGSFVPYPGIASITIVDIEPLIPQMVAPFFKDENNDVVHDPRVHIVYDDARDYVLTTPETFDIITSDPIHPWVKGSATLYTKEYFELVKRHLNPGGIVTQWVPLYESSPETVKSEIATFFEVFPNGTIWSNENEEGSGYDLVLLGQADGAKVDVMAIGQMLVDNPSVAASLRDVGFTSVFDLLSTYGGRASQLRPWMADAEINRDKNLRLQYLAGLWLNVDRGGMVYEDLLAYRQYPDDLFVAPEGFKRALVEMINEPRPIREFDPSAR